ncbi:MAG TPA: hypothetical protein VJM12_19500 [Pyrinomonadaceae bacterium]|nr:hypothetical protein [Pyrinomonadaceae bacterium]
MKRLIIVVLLVGIAAVAGIVRSYSKAGYSVSEIPEAVSGESKSQGNVRDEIRKNFDLSPGARVEVEGINGSVNVETADVKTAELYVERLAKSPESLARRKIVIENTPNSLTVRGKSGTVGFFGRLFGSSPTEKVTLKLPRQVDFVASGVNGAVVVGEIDGAVEVTGVNGRVDVARATGNAEFRGINGNVSVAFSRLDNDGVRLTGVNGNIELRLAEGVSAELEAHGMNGNVVSDLPDFTLEKAKHGNYHARVGSGGNSISASGINGNIRVTRASLASTTAEAGKSKS